MNTPRLNLLQIVLIYICVIIPMALIESALLARREVVNAFNAFRKIIHRW